MVSKHFKLTPTSFEMGSNTQELLKIKEQNAPKCNSNKVFNKLPQFQQCGRVLAKALQNKKRCKMRGDEGLIYLSKALNFLQITYFYS